MNARRLARDLLEEFARTRAPLMADAPAAVMRTLALAVVSTLIESAPEREVRVMAAGTLAAHLGETPPSKHQATRQEFAAASALFADVFRTLLDAQYERAAINKLIEYFAAFDDERDARKRTLKWLPRAMMVVAMCAGEDAAVQLRAARWVLSRTRALAERVGYGKSTEHAPPPGELSPKGTEGVPGADQKKSDGPAATPTAASGGSSPRPPSLKLRRAALSKPWRRRAGGAGADLRSRPPP